MIPQKLMEIRTTGAGMTRLIHNLIKYEQCPLGVFIVYDKFKKDYNWISKEVEERK